jgi:hypothetical protein
MDTYTYPPENPSSGFRRASCQLQVGEFTLCVGVPCPKVDRYCIRVKLFLTDRGNAQDICRRAIQCGGVMIREYCFAYAS